MPEAGRPVDEVAPLGGDRGCPTEEPRIVPASIPSLGFAQGVRLPQANGLGALQDEHEDRDVVSMDPERGDVVVAGEDGGLDHVRRQPHVREELAEECAHLAEHPERIPLHVVSNEVESPSCEQSLEASSPSVEGPVRQAWEELTQLGALRLRAVHEEAHVLKRIQAPGFLLGAAGEAKKRVLRIEVRRLPPNDRRLLLPGLTREGLPVRSGERSRRAGHPSILGGVAPGLKPRRCVFVAATSHARWLSYFGAGPPAKR